MASGCVLRSKLEAKLSSVIRDLDWFWQPARSNALVDVQSKLHSLNLGGRVTPIWLASKSKSCSTREILRSCKREKKSEVDWCCLFWFSLAIPRHSFIIWLGIKDSLTTGDRVLKWGAHGEYECLFCRGYIESQDHLFFGCRYNKRLWKAVM